MLKILIDNEEVVADKNLQIKKEMLNPSSVILNNCYPKEWLNDYSNFTNKFYFPKNYSKCLIYDNDDLKFCGAVLNTGNISLNPRYPHYCNLQVIDFKTLLSIGDTLDFVISNKTIEEAINMVVDAIKDYGFVVGDIKTLYNQDLIGNYSTQEKTPYDVFQYLAQISQSQWSTRMINENQIAIDFYDPTLMPTAPNILNTKEYFKENNIDDISYSYSSSDYRNKQIMLSDQVYGSIDYTETIVANGYQTTFNTLSNIGVMKSIKVNNESKTFISKTQSELGFSADFIYEIGKTTIEASKTWTAGDTLTIVYTPLVQGREITSNTDEISRIANNIGRRGVISRYENRNDATSSYELQRIGESYIRYKGYPTITLKIKTHNKDLFDIGQITTYEAPLSELSTTYMVKSKTITQIYAKDLLITNYEYELVNNFNSEKALNYFDNQRAKATGNLKEGEFITRNVDIENTATIIFEDMKITAGQGIKDNLLDSVLDSLFIY